MSGSLTISNIYCTFDCFSLCIRERIRRKSHELLNGSSSPSSSTVQANNSNGDNNGGVSLNVHAAETAAASAAPVKPKRLVITRQPLAQIGLVFDRFAVRLSELFNF